MLAEPFPPPNLFAPFISTALGFWSPTSSTREFTFRFHETFLCWSENSPALSFSCFHILFTSDSPSYSSHLKYHLLYSFKLSVAHCLPAPVSARDAGDTSVNETYCDLILWPLVTVLICLVYDINTLSSIYVRV